MIRCPKAVLSKFFVWTWIPKSLAQIWSSGCTSKNSVPLGSSSARGPAILQVRLALNSFDKIKGLCKGSNGDIGDPFAVIAIWSCVGFGFWTIHIFLTDYYLEVVIALVLALIIDSAKRSRKFYWINSWILIFFTLAAFFKNLAYPIKGKMSRKTTNNIDCTTTHFSLKADLDIWIDAKSICTGARGRGSRLARAWFFAWVFACSFWHGWVLQP